MGEEIRPGGLPQPLVGEHERDRLAFLPQPLQRRQRSRGGALGHHPVVLAVAARQLDLRASERIEIAIDGKQNRLSHAVMVTAVCKPD